MARARNIKYSFFLNDDLADCEPLARILFIGLWTIADFKGNLEFKSRKIKAQLLPYDDVDIDQLVNSLDKSRLISIYSNADSKYIHITNFVKHQNPHKNEKDKGTEIPTMDDDNSKTVATIDSKPLSDLIAINPDLNASDRADSCSLIPDSLILNPDSCSLNPNPLNPEKTLVELKHDDSTFNLFWDLYGKSINKLKCESKFKKLSQDCIDTIFKTLPAYIDSTPDKQFRKAPLVYLNNQAWNDEVIYSSGDKVKTIQQTINESNAQASRIRAQLGANL
jgi:hypothetical protein